MMGGSIELEMKKASKNPEYASYLIRELERQHEQLSDDYYHLRHALVDLLFSIQDVDQTIPAVAKARALLHWSPEKL